MTHAAPFSALAVAASAATGDRLPYQLHVVASHSWGTGTIPWVADTDGDGWDEVLGGNPELAQICPIPFEDGTYLEQDQLNLAPDNTSWHNVVYLGPMNIDGGAQFVFLAPGDVDGDGRDEIAFGADAPANGTEANGTNDTESYVGVLDDDGSLPWMERTGGIATQSYVVLVDLDDDGRLELVSGAPPNQDAKPVVSTVAAWDAVSGTERGTIAVPRRITPLFPGRTRRGEQRVVFTCRGPNVYALGWRDGAPAIVAQAETEWDCWGGSVVSMESVFGLRGDAFLVGLKDGTLAIFDMEARLLAAHPRLGIPVFHYPEFLGLYREDKGEEWLCGISDQVYLFDLVKSPFPWSLFWLVTSVAFVSAVVTAYSVSPPIRERTTSGMLRALAPLMPWAAAERT